VRVFGVPETSDVVKNGSPLHAFHGARGEIKTIDISRHNHLAASGGTDKVARVHDLTTGMPISILTRRTQLVKGLTLNFNHSIAGETTHSFEGHDRSLKTVQFNYRSNNLLTGSHDGLLGLWDLRNRKPIQFLRGHKAKVVQCSFDFFGNRVVSCSLDKLVNVWDLRKTQEPMLVLRDNTDEVRAMG